jgi:exosome complex RNA-binding protein Rrp42 (RNase PH superfamily)
MVEMVSKAHRLLRLMEAQAQEDRQVQVIFLGVVVLLMAGREELAAAALLALRELQIPAVEGEQTLQEVEVLQAAPALLSSSTP